MKLYTPSRVARRLGERFGFKAERDFTQKSVAVRRPYPPGMHGKRRSRGLSEFGAELAEKQKIRFLYGVSDTVLKRYVREAGRAKNKTKTQALLEILEQRLDNVVYRLGLVPSRRIARQVVSHGHIFLNGKRMKIPSASVKVGDRVKLREASRALQIFEGLAVRLKKIQPPEWLIVLPEELAGEMKRLPAESDNLISQNLSKVIEYYSR
jgi:small subunit ribosomal protein S4